MKKREEDEYKRECFGVFEYTLEIYRNWDCDKRDLNSPKGPQERAINLDNDVTGEESDMFQCHLNHKSQNHFCFFFYNHIFPSLTFSFRIKSTLTDLSTNDSVEVFPLHFNHLILIVCVLDDIYTFWKLVLLLSVAIFFQLITI